jgi:hypothetical protein
VVGPAQLRGLIEHEGHCPLGREVAEANRMGTFPPVLVGPSCERPR